MPFDALVEVGGELGPSFEAQAIDISEEGMHLRTAYLPEIGQPLMFRFDAGPGRQVIAGGEVTWKQELGKGGEFGVRFTNLDGDSVAALGRILGLGGQPAATQAPGSRVRLHIDGLASPMRARVKEAKTTEITAFSELGFLQVGKQLELEDATTGTKRPACIDRVEVQIDPETHVPQLVVTLRYDDDEARMEADRAEMAGEDAEHEEEIATEEEEEACAAAEPQKPRVELEPPAVEAATQTKDGAEDVDVDEASNQMRGPIARSAAKVGPAMISMMKLAKVTIALLAAKRRIRPSDVAIPLRRTTAPPPGGALHAAGRKVVRSEPDFEARAAMMDDPAPKKAIVTKRRAIVAGAVAVAGVLLIVATKKPAPQAPLASAPPPETAAVSPANATPIPPPEPAPMTPATAAPAAPPDPLSLSPAAKDEHEAKAPSKKKIAPFGNGPVAHGNVLRLKMDGAIDKIEGAQQPTGFSVVIPNRRSLEAAGPLAARDGRIASIRVSNDPNGAELTMAFKDGVPNYQVRARGDTLEIALAPIGQVNDAKSTADNRTVQAKHNDPGAKSHGKHTKNGHTSKH
jgi:hypothetical protein